MSRAMMMAALLGMGLALPDSAATPATTDISAGAVSGTPATGGAGSAPPTAEGEDEELMRAVFSVESVDRFNHSIVVRAANGALTTIKVAPTAEGFEVHKGDQVSLDYYQGFVISLGSANAPVADTLQTPTRANAPVLGAAGARQITSTARVTSVDGETGTLELTTSDGRPHAFVIQDPAVQARLSSLHQGDRVTVTYTESVAVAISRATGI